MIKSDNAKKTDEAIAVLVQKGDKEAFGELVERYQAKISRYGRKFLSGNEDIKDLVQEIFLKAYVNIKSFDAERNFSSWLYRIAHNSFVNEIKKKSRDRLLFFDFDLLFPHPEARETADGDYNRKEMREMLDRSLGKLSPKYREVLTLYYYEELGYKEIAEVLQLPVATIGVRLKRGKDILKKIIGENR